MKPPRIGLGTDLHVLEAGRPCVLGGLTFDCPVGPRGHSDGDALLHALADALLGAAGLPDLGTLFPDTAPQWHGAASGRFVEAAVQRVTERGLAVWSVDAVVQCERPRLGPRREELRAALAALLGIDVDRVNVKGKSLEGTSPNVETVAATVVVLLGER